MGGEYTSSSSSDTHHQQPAGLARYQSAPTSSFSTLLNDTNTRPPTDTVFSSRFMPPGNSKGVPPQNSSLNQPPPNTIHSHFMNKSENQILYVQQLPQGSTSTSSSGSSYSSSSSAASQMISDNQSQPSIPNNRTSNPLMDCSFLPPINMVGGSGTNTNLLRQSSSPAGFFANFDIQGIMTPISEIENKNMEMSDGFPSSWDDFSDGFLKGLEDDDSKPLSALENQNDEVGNQHRPPSMLSHHLSLPKASMEKLLQLQDSVPCKIRAKRGCATHPRSIAERVRRTRISERMRKLQELVPNMDKQTNTSDMLDLAVDYIKDLQDQVQTLSDNRSNCTCANQETQ